MPYSFDPVRPGDLIASDLMDRIIAAIVSLDNRVTVLESAGVASQAITILSPTPSSTLHVGDEMRIVGANFGIPALAVVTINNVRIDPTTYKVGSSSQLLIFNIPPIQGIPAAGEQATLTVSNAQGFASTTFTLLPFQQTLPTGELLISPATVPAGAITAGGNFPFVFAVTVESDVAETYALTANLQPQLAGWTATIVNSDNTPMAPAQLQLPAAPPPTGFTQNVTVLVAVPANAAANTQAGLSIAVASVRNPSGFSNSSANVPVVVGAATPPPSTTIIPAFSKVYAPGTGDATNGVTIPATATKVQIDFVVNIKQAGSYTVPAPTFDAAAGASWTATIKGASSFVLSAPDPSHVVSVVVSAQAGAAATQMTLKVATADNTNVGQIALKLLPK